MLNICLILYSDSLRETLYLTLLCFAPTQKENISALISSQQTNQVFEYHFVLQKIIYVYLYYKQQSLINANLTIFIVLVVLKKESDLILFYTNAKHRLMHPNAHPNELRMWSREQLIYIAFGFWPKKAIKTRVYSVIIKIILHSALWTKSLYWVTFVTLGWELIWYYKKYLLMTWIIRFILNGPVTYEMFSCQL